MKDWNNTRAHYNEWLSSAELKNKISHKIHYDGLSLWWISKLVDKDNINDQEWYVNLNKKINNKKYKLKKNYFFFFIFFLKFLKNFFFTIFYISVVKIFIQKKKK